MLIFALALAAPMPLSQKRGLAGGADLQANGRRWAGIVGDRIMFETGQPRELVAVAMNEAAESRAARAVDNAAVAACTRQMIAELATADAATQPLPKPARAQ
jgi:hypothetical protein